MAEVVTLETPSLGNRSYLVTDGLVAVVIDPQRDTDRFVAAAAELGVTITHVCETHVHNDYVTGGPALADRTGAAYVVAKASGLTFDHQPVVEGDVLRTGQLVVEVVETPGHTPHHVSYVLRDDGVATDVFTGGSLLYGSVGRTDLIADDRTVELARAQHASVQRLASMLPDETAVRPTHGFGSHCASGTSLDPATEGTIADERERNPALVAPDVDAFVEELLDGFHAYPTYYARMGPANEARPGPADLTLPAPVDAAAIRAHLHDGHWVVDLRNRRAYAADHVLGTVNVELRNDLPTYLGWVMPLDEPLVLLAGTEDELAEAQLMLSRIGIERPDGAATGGPEDWAPAEERGSWPAADWDDLATALAEDDDVVVLDVRDGWEFDSGHHPEALHIPFHEIMERRDEIPPGRVWVYCATGTRAAVTVSQLAAVGRDVVIVDDFCLPGDTPGA